MIISFFMANYFQMINALKTNLATARFVQYSKQPNNHPYLRLPRAPFAKNSVVEPSITTKARKIHCN